MSPYSSFIALNARVESAIASKDKDEIERLKRELFTPEEIEQRDRTAALRRRMRKGGSR